MRCRKAKLKNRKIWLFWGSLLCIRLYPGTISVYILYILLPYQGLLHNIWLQPKKGISATQKICPYLIFPFSSDLTDEITPWFMVCIRPLLFLCRVVGGWSLSQLTLGERRGRTGRQFIPVPTYSDKHTLKFTSNLESPINLDNMQTAHANSIKHAETSCPSNYN